MDRLGRSFEEAGLKLVKVDMFIRGTEKNKRRMLEQWGDVGRQQAWGDGSICVVGEDTGDVWG